MAVGIGVLSLITLGPMLVVDIFRSGAFTSWVAVELPVVSILSILWAATGGLSFQLAVLALGLLMSILLFCYAVVLLVFALIGQSRGNAVWATSVRDTEYLVRRDKAVSSNQAPYSAPSHWQAAPQNYSMEQLTNGNTTAPQYYTSPAPSQPATMSVAYSSQPGQATGYYSGGGVRAQV